LIKVLGAMLRIIENSFSYQANKGVKYIEPFLIKFIYALTDVNTLNKVKPF
jgi:hypothetical protein